MRLSYIEQVGRNLGSEKTRRAVGEACSPRRVLHVVHVFSSLVIPRTIFSLMLFQLNATLLRINAALIREWRSIIFMPGVRRLLTLFRDSAQSSIIRNYSGINECVIGCILAKQFNTYTFSNAIKTVQKGDIEKATFLFENFI